MKKDKIFNILNGEKPKKSVLDAAYAELDASRAEKSPRKNKSALKWAAGVLVPVLAVSVVIAILNPFGRAKSSAPMGNDNAQESTGNLDESDKSAAQELPFGFDYDEVYESDTASAEYSSRYATERGESVGITVLGSAPVKTAGAVDVAIDALGVTGFYILDGDAIYVSFSYGGGHYLLTIRAETDRLTEILSHISLN